MTIVQAVLLGAIQGLAEFYPFQFRPSAVASASLPNNNHRFFRHSSHVATWRLYVWCSGGVLPTFHGRRRWIIRKPRETDSSDHPCCWRILRNRRNRCRRTLLKDLVSDFSPFLISCCFVITGIFLFVSGRHVSVRTTAVPGVVQGLVIGLAQGIGVIPGISRSGSTISASLFAGLDRKTAGEFSFLLSIPAILAAFILELKSADTLGSHVPVAALAAGMLTAFAVGYLSLKFLLGLIQRGKLGWFAVYLIPAGIALAVYFFPG